jgi:hypothetical protein
MDQSEKQIGIEYRQIRIRSLPGTAGQALSPRLIASLTRYYSAYCQNGSPALMLASGRNLD